MSRGPRTGQLFWQSLTAAFLLLTARSNRYGHIELFFGRGGMGNYCLSSSTPRWADIGSPLEAEKSPTGEESGIQLHMVRSVGRPGHCQYRQLPLLERPKRRTPATLPARQGVPFNFKWLFQNTNFNSV